VGRYPFGVELFHLLLHTGSSRRFHKIDHEQAALYAEIVLAVLPEAARVHLEKLMATRGYAYQSDLARGYLAEGEAKGEAKGRAEGEARALLAILHARGILVPDDLHTRITTCTDLDQLDTWIRRASTATTIHDILD
jgi:hypothetical protein